MNSEHSAFLFLFPALLFFPPLTQLQSRCQEINIQRKPQFRFWRVCKQRRTGQKVIFPTDTETFRQNSDRQLQISDGECYACSKFEFSP